MTTLTRSLRWLQTPLLLLALLFAAGNGFAQSKDSGFPEFENEFFNDYTGTCTPAQKIEITRNLRLGSESSQIHTMIVAIRKMADYPGLPQEALAFASRLAQERKIGSQKTHQGILVLFSFEDKKYAVARSTNLPQSLSDSIREALSTRMRTKFRDGQHGQALVYAAEDIASSLPKASVKPNVSSSPASNRGQGTVPAPMATPVPALASAPGESSGLGLGSVLLVVVIGVALCSILSRLFSGGGGGGFGMGGGGGSGLGGLLGGLLGGGLLGYWLGNSSSHSGGGFFGSNTDSGGSSDGSSSDSSDSGGFDSFGGGDFGSGGDGGGSGSEGDL